MSWQHLNQPQGWIGVISLSLSLLQALDRSATDVRLSALLLLSVVVMVKAGHKYRGVQPPSPLSPAPRVGDEPERVNG